jgi:hypothetical protein
MAVDVQTRWRGVELWLSRRSAKCIIFGCLLVWFLAWRWLQRLEPWDSDDATLFAISARAATGDHWVLGAAAQGLDSATPLSHQALRMGLLPVSIPVILAFGASSAAYYLVPLLFALVGFVCVGWVALEHFGLLVALAMLVIHAVCPFELAHSSVFLVDLPSAALALASLCLLEAARRRERSRERLALAVGAGLALLESYFLRSNVLVLIAPALLVFLWRREARALVGVALGVLGLGLLGEQALFAWRGLGWGYGWSRVNLALEQYSEFLPVYSWGKFAIRQFEYQFTSFGRGITGALAALVLLAALLGHALAFRFERRPLLLAIMIFGAFTWLVFSFAIYERVDGGVRAMAPTSYRYIQPFTYSSVLVWAWAWCFIRERGWRRGAQAGGDRQARWLGAALVAVPLLLLGFSLDASFAHLPELHRKSESRRLFAALRARAEHDHAPVDVAGLPRGLRVARILCCGDDGPVRWRDLPAPQLADVIQNGQAPLVLRNVTRELSDARYMDPSGQALYRTALERVDDMLWRDYALVHLDSTYALFERRPGERASAVVLPPAPPLADMSRLGRREEATCRSTPTDDGALLELQGDGSRRTSCQYSAPQDGILLAERAPSSDYVLRVSVDYQAPLAMTVDVVQFDGLELHRDSQRIFPGTSYVPVAVRPGMKAAYVVYRINGSGLAHSTIAIEPARWALLPGAQG